MPVGCSSGRLAAILCCSDRRSTFVDETTQILRTEPSAKPLWKPSDSNDVFSSPTHERSRLGHWLLRVLHWPENIKTPCNGVLVSFAVEGINADL